MREYKFRGKPFEDVDFDEINVHISKDDFVYGNLIVDGKVAYIVNGIVEVTEEYLQLEQWIPIRPETIGQYTGLHDKNGKEIYEGDVVRYKDENLTIQWFQTTQGVGWHKDNGKEIELVCPFERFEIIGNIHDKGEVK